MPELLIQTQRTDRFIDVVAVPVGWCGRTNERHRVNVQNLNTETGVKEWEQGGETTVVHAGKEGVGVRGVHVEEEVGGESEYCISE